MKLRTRQKLYVIIFGVTLILWAVLLVFGYDSILTSYSVINGVEKIVYTPIWAAIGKLFIAMALSFTLWELAARSNEKKAAAEPELQSHRNRGYVLNVYFFFLSLVAPLACILTLLLL